MANERPQTYNDDVLNEISREVFFASLIRIRDCFRNASIGSMSAAGVAEVRAYAAAAEAASCGLKDEEESAYS